MSEIDFQNGLVVGLTLAGKNGAVGGVKPPSGGGGAITPCELSGVVRLPFQRQISTTPISYPV